MLHLLKLARIFLLGMREYRTDLTTHFDYPEIETYDRGRDWAHRLTFRRYDSTCSFGRRPR